MPDVFTVFLNKDDDEDDEEQVSQCEGEGVSLRMPV